MRRAYEGGVLALVAGQGLGVASFETPPHPLARGMAADPYEPPGLAQPHRGRQHGGLKQLGDQRLRQWVGTEAADVASPAEKLQKGGAECDILEGQAHANDYASSLAMTWKKAPLTPPRLAPTAPRETPVASVRLARGRSSPASIRLE